MVHKFYPAPNSMYKIMLGIEVILFLIAFFLDMRLGVSGAELQMAVSAMLPSFLLFVSLWFGAYQLFRQLYKDRFPESILEKEYKPISASLIVGIILEFTFGIYSLYANQIASSIAFLAVGIAFVCLLLIQSYCINQKVTIGKYIKRYTDIISDEIREKGSNYSEADLPSFAHLNDVFSESLAKREYYICISIQKGLSELFQAQIEENSRISICGLEKENQAKHNASKIIKALVSGLKELDDRDQPRFVTRIFHLHYKNLNKCLVSDQKNLFEMYIAEIEKLLFHLSKDEQRSIYRKCFSLIANCTVDSIGRHDKSMFEQCVSFYGRVTISSSFISDTNALCECVTAIASVLVNKIDEDDEMMKRLFKIFLNCSFVAAKLSDNFAGFSKAHTALFATLAKGNVSHYLDDYFDFLLNSYRYLYSDEAWTNCIYSFIEMLDSADVRYESSKIDKLKTHIVLTLLKADRNPSGILLSNHSMHIKEGDDHAVENAAVDFDNLLNEGLRSSKPDAVYTFCRELESCILALDASSCDDQEAMLHVLFDNTGYAAYLQEPSCFAICVQAIDECVRGMDRAGKISKDLSMYILEEIFGLLDSRHDVRYTHSIVNVLRDFMLEDKEVSFILKRRDVFEAYCNHWLMAGLECLENGDSEGTRDVSGAIGWLLLDSLHRGDLASAIELIDIAEKLNDFSNHFELKINDKLFLLTLFTVVGAYCCQDSRNYGIRDRVVSFLAGKDYESVSLAIGMRFMSDDTWGGKFTGSSKEHAATLLSLVRQKMA